MIVTKHGKAVNMLPGWNRVCTYPEVPFTCHGQYNSQYNSQYNGQYIACVISRTHDITQAAQYLIFCATGKTRATCLCHRVPESLIINVL